MTGRGKGGRGKGRGNRSGGRGKNQNNNKSKSRKTLAENIFYVGANNQQTDYLEIKKFITNHIKQKYQYGEDIGTAIETLTDTDLTKYKPKLEVSTESDATLKQTEDEENKMIYQAEVKRYVDRKAVYLQNKVKAYALFFNQCNKSMQEKIEQRGNYDTTIKGNLFELLKVIREISLSFQENKYGVMIQMMALQTLINIKQAQDENLIKYTLRFKGAHDVLISQ